MSYDESLPTDKDKVRLLVGDNDPDNEALTDNEIDWFISSEGNVFMAAAEASRSIAAKLASEGPSFAFGTFEMDQQEAIAHFKTRAEELENRASTGSGFGAPVLANPPEDGNEYTDVFEVGEMDHDPFDRTE